MNPPCKYRKDWFAFMNEEKLKTPMWKWVISQFSLFLGLQSCLSFYMNCCSELEDATSLSGSQVTLAEWTSRLSCVYPVSSHQMKAQTFYNLAIIEMPLSFIPFVLWVLHWKNILALFICVCPQRVPELHTSLLAVCEFLTDTLLNSF